MTQGIESAKNVATAVDVTPEGQTSWSTRATAGLAGLLAVGLGAIVAEEVAGRPLLEAERAASLGSLIDAMALGIALLTFAALGVRNRSDPDRLNLVTASVLAVVTALILPLDLVPSVPESTWTIALVISTRVVIIGLPLVVSFNVQQTNDVRLLHLMVVVLVATLGVAAAFHTGLRFSSVDHSEFLAVSLGFFAALAVLSALRLGGLSLRHRQPRGYVLALMLVAMAVADGHASLVETGSLSSASGKAMRLVVISAILVYTVIDLQDLVVRDRERALRAQNESERAADRLVAEMTFKERFVHDTRNALLAIQGGIRSLETGTGDEMIAALSSEVDRLRTLLEGDEADPLPGAFDVVHALAPMVACYQAAGCEIRFNASGPAIAHGRPSVTAEVAQNLIENALEHGGEGQVSVWAFERRDCIEVRVADRGGGIEVDLRETIFEYGTTRGESGSGVGLHISRGLIEQQGGTLDVMPRHGGGSIFAFTLPKAQRPADLVASNDPVLQ